MPFLITFLQQTTRMETIRTGTKGEIVKTLQQLLTENGYQAAPDGIFGEATSQAVRAFQRRQELAADGIVGYRTWEALYFSRRNQGTRLTRDDYERTARLIGCSTAALMAVKEVETGSQGGFLPSGKPVILFEGHIFWNQLKQRGIDPEACRAGHEDILYPSRNRKYYLGGEAEHDRLERARKIDREAADASASWGMFQIMGFNHVACGEQTVAGFVEMMSRSELHQLLLSARFIYNFRTKAGGRVLVEALKETDWSTFARYYNGPDYASNHYDTKLADAYEKYR